MNIHIFCCRTDSCRWKLSSKVFLMLDNPFPVPFLCKLKHTSVHFIQKSMKSPANSLFLQRKPYFLKSDPRCFGPFGTFQDNKSFYKDGPYFQTIFPFLVTMLKWTFSWFSLKFLRILTIFLITSCIQSCLSAGSYQNQINVTALLFSQWYLLIKAAASVLRASWIIMTSSPYPAVPCLKEQLSQLSVKNYFYVYYYFSFSWNRNDSSFDQWIFCYVFVMFYYSPK